MEMGVGKIEATLNCTPRDGVTEAGFQFTHPLESSGPNLC